MQESEEDKFKKLELQNKQKKLYALDQGAIRYLPSGFSEATNKTKLKRLIRKNMWF